MAKFVLKKRPKEPVRGTVDVSFYVPSNNLGEILKMVEEKGLDPAICSISCYYGAHNATVYYCQPEPDRTWKPKLKAYQRKLRAWTAWKDQNKDAIREEELHRAEERKKKKEARLLKEQEKLNAQAKAIHERLNRVEEELSS
jgi:hypothetical protein